MHILFAEMPLFEAGIEVPSQRGGVEQLRYAALAARKTEPGRGDPQPS